MITPSLFRRSLVAAALTSAAAVAQVDWNQVAFTTAPDSFCGYCWDSGRDRLVAFGGVVVGQQSSSMREWTGSGWVNVNPPVRPSSRTRPAMAYDEARGQTVLFGGGNAFLNDTWTYDGTTWTQRSPATSPPGRQGAAMAYDRARQVVVLFGGFTQSGNDSSDVWEWDGTNWTQRLPFSSFPPRGAHRMVYHDGLERCVMVGGYNTQNQITLADAWAWDGASWTSLPSLPGSVCDQAMAYDPARSRIVLFGGLRIQGGVLTDLDDTFEFTASWVVRNAGVPPLARNAAANAYDPANARVLVAGGTAGTATFNDTWAYELTQPASAVTFGQPCAVTQGVDLELQNLPYIGQPFEQRIVDASPAAAIGLVVYGGSNTTWNGAPLPFDLSLIGAPGCSVNVSVDVASTVLLQNGAGATVWNLPNVPAAVGSLFFTQGVVLDPASPLPFQVDMTSGRQLVIGNP